MDRLKNELMVLANENRLRGLYPACGVDFTSNDYLGFRQHPALRQAAIEALQNGIEVGAGGSRVLRGNHSAHESLEAAAVKFFGAEASLYFANGFLANLALMSMPARQDIILFDAFIHASLRDGIQANAARHIRIPHNNLDAFDDALRRVSSPERLCWVAVESVYSMDGDLAPLPKLLEICKNHGAYLIVDEAHATGIFGPQGSGLTHGLKYERLITLHTCGKALGVAGALVCSTKTVIDTLINRARSFIYTTAPMPIQATLVEKALQLSAEADATREKLSSLCALAAKSFSIPSPSTIFPVILGDDRVALETADYIQSQGFDVRAIRPPTVPENTARLRIAINALLTEADILGLAKALKTHAAARVAA
ncbi:MAG: 8-amino-7-oxononanoate synthase [Proteobacteria bacterium]|nr:8-amino-7-oxononanoate synthase [Pseudomonadota bacterium]